MSNPRTAPKKHRRTGPARLGGRPTKRETLPDDTLAPARRLSARCDEALHKALLLHCREHEVTRTSAIRKAVKAWVAKSLAIIAKDLK